MEVRILHSHNVLDVVRRELAQAHECRRPKPLLDAYHRSCYEAMVRAGLIEKGEEGARVWEDDLEERFTAYNAAYEQVHARPDFSLRMTGRESVGWLFARYLFPGTEPDPRLVLLLNEFGSVTFTELAEMCKSLEGHYRRGAPSWWRLWK